MIGLAGGTAAVDMAQAPTRGSGEKSSGVETQERAAASAEIAALRQDLRRIASSQARSGRDVEAARSRLALLNARETALTAEMSHERSRLGGLLVALTLFRRDPPPPLLVRPDDARDAVRAAILIRAMTPALEQRAQALAKEAQQIATLRREAAGASAALFSAESQAAGRRGDLERLLDQQKDIESRYPEAAQSAGRAAGSPGTLADSFPRVASADTGPGPILRPVQGAIVRGYSAPASPGLWIRAPLGGEVVSPVQGVVEFAGPVTGWGVILIIRTTTGYHLVLGGLDQATAAAGRSVTAGQAIGRMSASEGTGPELYLELRRGGAPIDPVRWLATR